MSDHEESSIREIDPLLPTDGGDDTTDGATSQAGDHHDSTPAASENVEVEQLIVEKVIDDVVGDAADPPEVVPDPYPTLELAVRATSVDSDFGSDADSDGYSDVSEISVLDETMGERFAALADIVHPKYRDQISTVSSATASVATGAVWLSSRAFWVLSTSMLLLGVPWALAYSEDQQLMEMEKEERIRMMGNEVLTQGGAKPPSDGLLAGQEVKAAV